MAAPAEVARSNSSSASAVDLPKAMDWADSARSPAASSSVSEAWNMAETFSKCCNRPRARVGPRPGVSESASHSSERWWSIRLVFSAGARAGALEDDGGCDMRCDSVTRTRHLRATVHGGKIPCQGFTPQFRFGTDD